MTKTPHDTVLLDVDGTLVDSTHHHAIAWHRAFRSEGIELPVWRVHRAIGMGGDKLVTALAGDDVEHRLGDRLREAWQREYEPLRDEIEPLPGAGDLVRRLKERGFTVALGSSGKPDHTRQAIDLVGIAELVDAVTTSEDADDSKPAPDILQVALDRSGGHSALVIGDSRMTSPPPRGWVRPAWRSGPAVSAWTSWSRPDRSWSSTAWRTSSTRTGTRCGRQLRPSGPGMTRLVPDPAGRRGTGSLQPAYRQLSDNGSTLVR